MRHALTDLDPHHLEVIYPGSKSYALADTVTAVPLNALATGGLRSLTGNWDQ